MNPLFAQFVPAISRARSKSHSDPNPGDIGPDQIPCRLEDASPHLRLGDQKKMEKHTSPTSPLSPKSPLSAGVPDSRKVTIVYATETGNAQDFATLLGHTCTRLRFHTRVCCMDELAPEDLPDLSLLIVVCSTTGQGEVPKNGKQLWRFLLRRKLPPTFLSGVKYTTFGLGDSSYPRFNWAVRKIHKRLGQLGARELGTRGECDDMSSDSIESMYHEWEAKLSEALLKEYPLPEGVFVIPGDKLLSAQNPVSVLKNKPKRDTSDADLVACSRSNNVSHGVVTKNDRITAKGHFQDVRHFSFSSSDQELRFDTGDTVALFPQNTAEDVQLLLEDQGWSDIADYKLEIGSTLPNIEGGYVKPLTLRSLFTHHLDIMAIPRQSFFTYVFHFATDERQKERLQEFSQPGEGLEDLFDYANRPRRSILEVVTEFDSLKIPLKYVFDVFPIMRPRLFSIAQKADSLPVDLCVAIVKYQTIIKRIREGVLTRWLGGLKPDQKIVFARHESALPVLNDRDVVMVAPGTGVAPMRSLILSRDSSKETVLFFGNRYKEKDFLFQDDLESAQKAGKLQLFTSFSRDTDATGYVQQEMYRQKELLGRLLYDNKGVLYVCGSSGKMPREVRITVTTCLSETRGLSEDDAEAFVKQMEKDGRYLQETW